MRRSPKFAAFRRPQFIAAGFLLAYLLQCVWLVEVEARQALALNSDQSVRIYLGLQQWRGGPIAGTPQSLPSEAVTGLPSAARDGRLRIRDGYDEDRSPLYYLVPAAPLLTGSSWLPKSIQPLQAASPYLFFGVMLGGSLWYVARRLYGNAGGYIALSLYCFSPAAILNAGSSQSLGEIGAVWGAFGTIFTALAVAHTLYAPREVIIWNSRRIFILGLSLALAVGNQFSLAMLALVILTLMYWVAPVRPKAVLIIWSTALSVAAVILFAAYFFQPSSFWGSMTHARWFEFTPSAFTLLVSYRGALHSIIAGSPPLLFALPAAILVYVIWKRTRYFGNSAPLLIAALLLLTAIGVPDFPGHGFHLAALVLLFLFVAGICSDLLETSHQPLVAAALFGILGTAACLNLLQLWRI